MKKIKSCLISVFYKTNLDKIVALLKEQNVQIYATGGTYDFIKELDNTVKTIESLTSYPSILGGRVKTLHPKVFGGILGRLDNEKDVEEMKQYEIPAFDLVIVDLYPFEETVKTTDDPAKIIEKIDAKSDHYKSMSDEELAWFLCGVFDDGSAKFICGDTIPHYDEDKIVEWLKNQKAVTKVIYPGLKEHPGYEIMKMQSRGFGAMVTFNVTDEAKAKKILGSVKLIQYAESLGGVETLITYPTTELTPNFRTV